MSMFGMNKKIGIALLLAATMGFALQAQAGSKEAEQRFLSKFPAARLIGDSESNHIYIAHRFATSPLTGDITVAAKRFVEENAALFGLDGPSSELELDKVVPHLNSRYVRFHQFLDGLPVFNSMIIAHVDAKKRIVKVSAKSTQLSPTDWEPVLDMEQARGFAVVDLTEPEVLFDPILGYFNLQGRPILVYRVVVRTPGAHIWVSFVDAVNGSIVSRYDAVKRHLAEVYTENPTTTPDRVEVDLDTIVTEGEHVNHTYGAYARTASCTGGTNASTMECLGYEHLAEAEGATDAGPGDGFLNLEPELDGTVLTDAFAEVQVYYIIDMINQWFRSEFGFDAQFGDLETADSTLVQADYIWVLANMDFQNGYMSGGGGWGGQEQPYFIALGRIGTKDLAYDGEVAMHEFTHAVSSRAFNNGWMTYDEWGVDTTAGGVEEGTADYFAASTSGTPFMAEYVGAIGRDLDNENKCPNNITGEGHEDGQIVGGTIWQIREGLGKRKTDHLHYGALSGNSINGLTDLGNALVAQAEWMAGDDTGLDEDLVFTAEDVAFVETVVAERNLIDCERAIPMEEGVTVLHFCQMGFGDSGMPSAAQYLVTTTGLTEKFTLNIASLGSKTYDVYMSVGEPVLFTWSGTGMSSTWTADYDHEWLYDTATSTPVSSVEISGSSTPAVEPETDYYFSIICKTANWGEYCYNNVSVSFEEGTSVDTDTDSDTDTDTDTDIDTDTDTDTETETGTDAADDDDDDDDDDGCGCKIGVSANKKSPASVLINLLTI